MEQKSVYEQMAIAGAIVSQSIVATGTAPNRAFVLKIEYANGLCVECDGTARGFQARTQME